MMKYIFHIGGGVGRFLPSHLTLSRAWHSVASSQKCRFFSRNFLLIFLFCLLVPCAVNAQVTTADSQAVSIGGGDTQIIVDNQANVIRFVINGEVKAFLDERGLSVVNDIAYGGMLTDVGSDGINTDSEALSSDKKEASHEK